MSVESQPIFIVGSVRSGTSIVAQALRDGAGIPGYTEGCFIDFLGAFMEVVRHNYARRPHQKNNPQVMLGTISQDELTEELCQWFARVYERHAVFGTSWVDKTADKDAIRAMPFVHRIWPHAKIIFMKRRAIENVASRLRKFPEKTFREHCDLWVEANTMLQSVMEQMPIDSYVLLDQYDVATQPQQVARKVGTFLNLSATQIEHMASIFTHARPEHTGGMDNVSTSIAEQSLSDEDTRYFMETCSSLMEQMGWTSDERYYQ